MTLFQDRMIAVCLEAIDCAHAFNSLKARIREALDAHARGECDAAALVTLIQFELDAKPRPPMDRVFAEQAHFKATRARNNYARKYMERRRRAAGALPRKALPHLSQTEQAELAQALQTLAPAPEAEGPTEGPGLSERLTQELDHEMLQNRNKS